MLEYLYKSSKPTVMVGPSSVLVGKPLTSKIAGFSSRGPNALAPEILKPDIAAPGSGILAAVPPNYDANDKGFAFMSGLSMAAPHVSGIVALLRALHPQWSPAAIKSALVTTAWNKDSYKTPIIAEGSPAKIADPFDYGGGIVNPNGAGYPGLVFDMNKEDYLNYLCSQDYRIDDIYNATKETPSYNATAEDSICENRVIISPFWISTYHPSPYRPSRIPSLSKEESPMSGQVIRLHGQDQISGWYKSLC